LIANELCSFVFKKKLLLGIYTCEGFSKHPVSFWELLPCFYIRMKVEEPPKHYLEEHESLLVTSPLTWSSRETTAGDKYCQTIQDIINVALFLRPFKRISKAKFARKLVNICMEISLPISWILT